MQVHPNDDDADDDPKAERNKGGRPALDPDDQRVHGIRVRYSKKELAELMRGAQSTGMTLAAYVREVSLGIKERQAHKIRRI